MTLPIGTSTILEPTVNAHTITLIVLARRRPCYAHSDARSDPRQTRNSKAPSSERETLGVSHVLSLKLPRQRATHLFLPSATALVLV